MSLPLRQSGCIALAILSAVCVSRVPLALAQETEATVNSRYLELDHTASSRLGPADLSLIHDKRSEIAAEAAFFGYDLRAGEWDYDAGTCPVIPGQLILHYRRHFPNGAQSLFTALVPRQTGRVWVVPVLYRNATPFRSATGSQRSIAVFNRVVPPDLAAKAVQPEGDWLSYALCYADIVYGNANILSHPGTEVGLSHAPMPLLRLSEASTNRSIVFTDRNAPGEYLVWNLTMNDKGQMLAATAEQLSDYVAKERNGAQPSEKPMPTGTEPAVKPLPPQKEPTVKPRPQ
ncbi:MAG TPA: hypothetical protein VHE33_08645 [Acidobacteriaceae bacterium]|nr:hypothetical protein [Acidobacteriaceae bacterium]